MYVDVWLLLRLVDVCIGGTDIEKNASPPVNYICREIKTSAQTTESG